MKKNCYLFFVMLLLSVQAMAVDFAVKSNSTTKWIKLYDDNELLVIPDSVVGPETSAKTYYYSGLSEKVYTLKGLGYSVSTDTIINGSINIDLAKHIDTGNVGFNLLTVLIGANNNYKDADNKTQYWLPGEDYTIDNVQVLSREGYTYDVTLGQAESSNRCALLVFEGCSYSVRLVAADKWRAQGYGSLTLGQTVNSNVNALGKIEKIKTHTITVEKGYNFFLGVKPGGAGASMGTGTVHYKPFSRIEPDSIVSVGDNDIYYFTLTQSQQYNFRAWKDGKTPATGYFTMDTIAEKMPELIFNSQTMPSWPIDTIDRELSGVRVNDIYLNINERGHLLMNIGDTKDLLAQRNWEVINTTTGNYFIEPNYHYTVYNLEGKIDSSVVAIDNANTSIDPWPALRAKANGTAIVTVTYDAMNAVSYSASGSASKGWTVNRVPFYGGENWGAIWPENTGVFVVTVGQTDNNIETGMKINAAYNAGKLKIAGEYVDAEHDVFYFLKEKGYAEYTFTPQNVKLVEITYPTIGEHSAVYDNPFNSVNKNDDGSYTLQLKEGRNIVRLTNEAGQSVYQVLTAKPCTMDIANISRPGKMAHPGDRLSIQFSGLFHPANKMAGIYNMSAYVTYKGVPAGTALILSSNQYAFASTPKAQQITIDIPAMADPENGMFTMSDGVIQVTGFGDPIGNHRNITKQAGRSPNFTAVSHQTYFGKLPDITIPLEESKKHIVVFRDLAEGASVDVMTNQGDTVEHNALVHQLPAGNYHYCAKRDGYSTMYSSFTLSDSQNDTIFVNTGMQALSQAGVWDGTTKSPVKANDDGVYLISNAAELAWFADTINNGEDQSLNAQLTADINLAGFIWTAIGNASKNYMGVFDGQGHTIRGLYINATSAGQGLFGLIAGATIKNLTVEGSVNNTLNNTGGIIGAANTGMLENLHFYGSVCQTGGQFTGGIIGNLYGTGSEAKNLANHGNIYGMTSVAGIAGRHYTGTIENAFNWGNISGTGLIGGITGTANQQLTNVYNIGMISMRATKNAMTGAETKATTWGALAGTTNFSKLTNGYASLAFNNESNPQNKTIIKTIEQMTDGSFVETLGEGWGQQIGIDPYPIIGGENVITLSVANNVNSMIETIFTNQGKAVKVVPYEIEGYRFKSWEGYEGTDIEITISADSTIKANYIKLYNVDVEVQDGGTVSGNGIYEEGAEVVLRAQANEGYRFKGWSNGQTTDSITLTVTDDIKLKALFVALYTVTIETETSAGVTSLSCIYEAGETATVNATKKDHYLFKGWKGLDTQETSFSFIIERDTTFTAMYVALYTLTAVAQDETMGDVIIIGEQVEEGLYEEGTPITLKAVAKEGYEFDGWDDGVNDAERTIMLWDNAKIVAHFKTTTDIENIANEDIQEIRIYSFEGQLIGSVTDKMSNVVSSLPQGMFILKTEKQTTKVVK